jgi:hypothetical protein
MSLAALVNCIQAFAAESSNPVLATLPSDAAVETERKYPAERYCFGGAGLSAYYHCHGADNRPADEHGHFHLFVQLDHQWSHLAALSMDRQGQPLQWFSVNLWVTGETWSDPDKLIAALDQLEDKASLSLTEQWLLAMTRFYRATLEHLLVQRDQQLETLRNGRDLDTVWQDRQIYTLSSLNINLFQDIQQSAEVLN